MLRASKAARGRASSPKGRSRSPQQRSLRHHDQDSIALAEAFLEENASLIHGTEHHDCYKVLIQEVFRVPNLLTVRGLGSPPIVPAPVKQETGTNDKDVPSAQGELVPTLSLEEQLPFLRLGLDGAIDDEYSPPKLTAAITPSLTNFQMAFVGVRQAGSSCVMIIGAY